MGSQARFTSAIDLPQFVPADWGGYLARALASGERLFDLIAVLAAVYAADAFSRALHPPSNPGDSRSIVFFCATAFALLFVLLLARHGGYRPCLSLLAIRETERVLRVTLQTFSIALVTAYFCAAPVSRIAVGCALFLVPLFLTFEKWELHRLLLRLRSKGHGTRRAVILGTGSAARRIYTALLQSPKLGVEPVAFVEEGATAQTTEIYECSYRRKHSAKVLAGPLCAELFRQLDASVLVIAEPAIEKETMLLTMSQAAELGVDAYFATEDFLDSGSWLDYAELDGIMLARISKGTTRVLYRLAKRALDVLVAATLVLLAGPLAAVIAILIKKTSPGPVLFRQTRVGRAGRLFTIYKLRTMYQEAPDYGYSPGQVDDPRVTQLGRFLRRTSLDELPQLINVLMGQMSIVGPRPEMPFIVGQYTALQRQRLTVKPGMTGLWQISADRAFQIHENLEYDLYYIRHRSLFMDLAIVLHTLWFAPRGI